MNIASSDPIAFRLPGTVVRRRFVLHTAAIVAVLAGYHVLSQQSSVAALAGAASLAALVLAVGYGATARRVWLTVSSVGISSVGYTGRRVELPWSVGVSVAKSRRSGYKGHTVAEQGAGLLRSATSAIFIPAPIAASPEFAHKVAEWAPVGHPLRAIAGHAA
jgi:hypothetical protein